MQTESSRLTRPPDPGLPPDAAVISSSRQGVAGRAREDVILSYLPLVQRLSRRYGTTEHLRRELVQAGSVGLIQAVDRYDPSRGIPFVAYAIPTVTGAMRRYLRDNLGLVRRPRPGPPAAEGSPRARRVEYTVRLCGVGVDPQEHRWLGVPDRRAAQSFRAVEDRQILRQALRRLPPRDQTIIYLRFFEDRTLGQIAIELQLSVSRVSRLLAAALATLRRELTLTATAPPPHRPARGGGALSLVRTTAAVGVCRPVRSVAASGWVA